jgi:DGQHR domain-containing protein
MTAVDNGWISAKCLDVTQPIGTFYVCILNSQDLVRLSYSDIRRIVGERRDVETYLGIERPLNRKRVAALKEYVRTVDASFPTSIILAVSAQDSRYDSKSGVLQLRDFPQAAKILDGQHRIAGLEEYDGPPFQAIVTIFVDLDIENQALVFATINLEQTKVNKSLAYDLFEYTKQRSPQKTAHNIVRLLDSREGSPFKGKIKILGTAGDPGESISQALFVDALLPLISQNPNKDRDLLKRKKQPARASPTEQFTLIFRDMFIDERDGEIARILWNYFGVVEDKWTEFWRTPKPGYVLNRTTGFRGLMLYLPFAYLSLAKPGQIPTKDQFKGVFDRVRLSGAEITPDNYPPGTTGSTRLRDQLLSQTGLA